jgi:hypothetical protein
MPGFNLYPDPYEDGRDADTRIEVIWNRGGVVYVGSTKLREGADRNTEIVPVVDGSAVPHASAIRPDAEYERAWSGYLPPLSRQQLNKLIETLRRARDQAYGKDA